MITKIRIAYAMGFSAGIIPNTSSAYLDMAKWDWDPVKFRRLKAAFGRGYASGFKLGCEVRYELSMRCMEYPDISHLFTQPGEHTEPGRTDPTREGEHTGGSADVKGERGEDPTGTDGPGPATGGGPDPGGNVTRGAGLGASGAGLGVTAGQCYHA